MTTAQGDGKLELWLQLYRQMLLIRKCEEQLAESYQRGLIHGACHTYVGQEAIAAGVCAHLRPTDVVFSTHRGHGHALAKGLPPRELMAEVYGRATGCSRGRGGSMHLFAPEIGLMGTSGIIGPSIPQAAGAGYNFKLLQVDNLAVAFFGDGAVNNGAFHEGLNMASIWKLPVLFVCENNQFATEVPFAYSTGNPSVAARSASYGIAGDEVDGNDALAVYQVAAQAVLRARSGDGPTLIECKTYRTRPHAEGMGDFVYRSREEVEKWKNRCPIARLRRRVLAALTLPSPRVLGEGLGVRAAALDRIDAEVAGLVAEAHEFAQRSPWPDPITVTTHVFAEPAQESHELGGMKDERKSAPAAPPQSVSSFISHPSSLTLPSPGLPGEGSGVRASSVPSENAPREINWMQATREALADEMAKNQRIFVLGEGIGKRGGNFETTTGLFDLYGPLRLCDTPICERGFIGLACGAAMTGARPVVDFMFVDFILDAAGEILNQAAKIQYMSSGRIKMPLLLRGCVGIGHSTATHHSGNHYPMYAHFPGLRVVVPSNPYDAKGLFTRALRSDDPVLFLEHRELLGVKGPVPRQDFEIEFGHASVIRPGRDVTVVALALMVKRTLEACDRLAARGIEVEVVDPRTVAPLDAQTILHSVHKTGRLLIVDEAYAPFGLGAEVTSRVIEAGFDDLDAPIRRLHGAFGPTPYSPPLEKAVVPQAEDIERAILNLLEE